MTSLQTSSSAFRSPPFARPMMLAVIESEGRCFFAEDIEPLVLQACRAKRLGFDLFATRFNVPRATLVEILRGHAPVAPQTRRILEDFIARTLGPDAAVPPQRGATA